MTYTMEDFHHQFTKEHFAELTPQEQREALERLSPDRRSAILQGLPPEQLRELLQGLPPEQLLAVLSTEQIRAYLNDRTAARPQQPPKPRRKKK